MQSGTTVTELAATMRVLGNPARLAILRQAAPDEVSVSDLADQLGLPQATTSQHLRVLRDGGLVSVRVDGNHRYYKTSEEQLSKVTGFLESLWSRDLGALKAAAEPKHRQQKKHGKG